MDESDPKALFQQMIPTTYLALQSKLRDRVKAVVREGMADGVIMEEAEFKREFLDIFGGDEEELQEAVYCLNLQGGCGNCIGIVHVCWCTCTFCRLIITVGACTHCRTCVQQEI